MVKGGWREKTGGFTVIRWKSVGVKEWKEKMESMKNRDLGAGNAGAYL